MAWMIGKTLTPQRTSPGTELVRRSIFYAFTSELTISQMSKARASKVKPKAQTKSKPAPPATTTLSAYRPAVSREQEDAFMSGLLDDWDVTQALATSKASSRPAKRKPSSDYHYDDRSSSPGPSTGRTTAYSRSTRYSHRDPFVDTSSDGPTSDGFDVGGDLSSDDGLITSPKKKVRTETKGIVPAIEKMGSMEVAGNLGVQEDDYFDDITR